MQIVSYWDNLHEMSKSFFPVKIKKIIQNVICWNFQGRVNKLRKIATKKKYLYNLDPFKPHFYIVKLGFRGVYIIFSYFCSKLDCGYLLEPPRRIGSNKYLQSMFWAEICKKQNKKKKKKKKNLKTFIFLVGEIFNIFE